LDLLVPLDLLHPLDLLVLVDLLDQELKDLLES